MPVPCSNCVGAWYPFDGRLSVYDVIIGRHRDVLDLYRIVEKDRPLVLLGWETHLRHIQLARLVARNDQLLAE